MKVQSISTPDVKARLGFTPHYKKMNVCSWPEAAHHIPIQMQSSAPIHELYISRINEIHLKHLGEPSSLVFQPSFSLEPPFFGSSQTTPWDLPGTLISRLKSANHGTKIVFPQVPATVPSMLTKDGSSNQTMSKINQLPAVLQKPLIKIEQSEINHTLETKDSENHQDTITAYTSGLRSAVLRVDERFFRLKGCGNGSRNSDIITPFPVRPLGSDTCIILDDDGETEYEEREVPKPCEIRGCMYDFSAKREQAITALVNKELILNNLCVANQPMGYYVYETVEIKDHLGNDQKVQLCCGLYETQGDKRLSSHLLWGLELMIPFLISLESRVDSDKNLDLLHRIFPQSRFDGVSVGECGMSVLVGDYDSLVDLLKVEIPSENLVKLAQVPDFPKECDPLWQPVWNEAWESLITLQNTENQPKDSVNHLSSIFGFIAFIFWRIGIQTGQALRVIHGANVNWGTYTDLLGSHCNSHPNNFVVLDESNGDRFLAPLDFDLAFTKDSFCPINVSSEEEKSQMWEELKNMEVMGMQLALAGMSLNTGVVGLAPIPAEFEPIRTALRDTLILGFNAGFNSKEDTHPVSSEKISKLVHSAIKIALILTESLIA